ncbi:MAG: YnfA family protein [Phycisphaeraceae bacterium]
MIAILFKAMGLYLLTAAAELTGCYLVFRWLRHDDSVWLTVPAFASLAAFAWLLTLHPGAAGRTYAGYGAVYLAMALAWLWAVEGQRPTLADLIGVGVCLVGMAIIILGNRAG